MPEAAVLLPLLLSMAAAVDAYRRRIPNLISLGGAVLGLALWMHHGGMGGLATGTLGWIIGAALFFPFYWLKGMGAGDVKLMGMVGVALGAYHVLWAAVASALVGGLMAAWTAFSQRRLRVVMRDSIGILAGRLPAGRIGETAAARDAIPFGLAIAAGTLLYMVVRFVG